MPKTKEEGGKSVSGDEEEDLYNKSCQTDVNFKELMDKLNNMDSPKGGKNRKNSKANVNMS